MKIFDKTKDDCVDIGDCVSGTIVTIKDRGGVYMVLDTEYICSIFETRFEVGDEIIIVNCETGDIDTILPYTQCCIRSAEMTVE